VRSDVFSPVHSGALIWGAALLLIPLMALSARAQQTNMAARCMGAATRAGQYGVDCAALRSILPPRLQVSRWLLPARRLIA
jgi:hypothetical protein